MFRAADKLYAREHVNPTGQQHGEALDLHAPVLTSAGGRPVPLVKVPTPRLVVNVVEETVLRDQKSVALEGTG